MRMQRYYTYSYASPIIAMVILTTVTMVSASVIVTLTFNGTQYMRVSLPREQKNEIEDFSMKFRTEQSNCLLFVTSSNSTDDLVMAVLDGGRIRLDFELNRKTETVWTGSNLDDNTWHELHVRRRQKRLLLHVDDGEQQKGKILHKAPVTLAVKYIHLGARDTEGDAPNGRGYIEDDDYLPSYLAEHPSNFIGQMQSFVYNGHDYFHDSPDSLDTNADIALNDAPTTYDLTFKSQDAFVIIKYDIKRSFAMYFNFKTTQADGLILYSGRGNANDFMVVELFNCNIRYVFDVGNGPVVVESNHSNRLNDNTWHSVSIIRSNLIHTLTVDRQEVSHVMQNGGAVDLDTSSDFYIGGASWDIFSYLPDKVKSRVGFVGCLGEIDLEMHDVYDYKVGEAYRDMVTHGCEGPKAECKEESCMNGGRCEQGWDTYVCDCSMTTFSGPACEQESTSYRFASRGVMTFTQHERDWVDTRFDHLALGIKTRQSDDAVLVRVNSGDSEDFTQMELIEGCIFVEYNMGTDDHHIIDAFSRVDDGEYHVVRFTRYGPNSTLQIDDGDIQSMNPSGWGIQPPDDKGHQLNTFNKQARVFVGGRKDKAGAIDRAFNGTITGLVLNKQPILDYALNNDPRINIEGEAYPNVQPTLTTPGATDSSTEPPVLSTPSNNIVTTVVLTSTDKNDDLVSGMSSGCGVEPGADCFENPDPTRLVVPRTKIVRTTSVRPMTTPPLPDHSGVDPCLDSNSDDDDCFDDQASGDDDLGFTADLDPIDPADTNDPKLTSEPDFEFTGGGGDGDDNNNEKDRHNMGDATRIEIDVSGGRIPEIIQPDMTETPPHPRRQRTTTTEYPSYKSTHRSWVDQDRDGGGQKTTKDENANGAADTHEVKPNPNTNPFALNIVLIIGIALGMVLLLLIIAFALYKYRSREEGTHKAEDNKQYRYESVSTNAPAAATTNGSSNGVAKAQTDCPKTNKKKGTVKEWYV